MRPARLRQAVNKVRPFQGRNALHEPILGALLQKKTKPNHGLKAQRDRSPGQGEADTLGQK